MSDRPTALDAIASDPSTAGLVLDFDGVLSPIVLDPTATRMPDRVATTLSRLAKSLGLLAVMSGRPLDFLIDRIRIPGIRLLGSYGFEQIGADGRRHMDSAAEPWLGKVEEAGRVLGALFASSPGISVEEKPVSVAVHWRQAPNHDTAAVEVRRAADEVAERTGLRVEPGKLVEELRPPIAVDKGSAIRSLIGLTKPRIVAYAGDDLGDIPALRAVREVGGYPLVVDHGKETDSRLLQLADQVYTGTEAFAEWLAELADATGE